MVEAASEFGAGSLSWLRRKGILRNEKEELFWKISMIKVSSTFSMFFDLVIDYIDPILDGGACSVLC